VETKEGAAVPTLVVTGGAKGIGLGAVERFRADGWDVAIVDVDDEAGEAQAARLGGIYVHADATSRDELFAAFATVAERHGTIDCLIPSAGITIVGPSADFPEESWRKVIDLDLNGVFYACQAAVEHMPEGSSVVLISSIAAFRGMQERAAYCVAKAGVLALVRVLSAEWAARGVRVNAVAPGWVHTPFLDDAAAKGYVDLAVLAERPPIKRLATVEDIVGAIRYLASPEASFVTGQTLTVDGGWTYAF
jgi:NAD(P)-dependent dehydrogenase (short-subunit alcohol dehydrogenase family)